MNNKLIILTVLLLLGISKSIFALPVYNNYTSNNIFTQKVRVGYYSGYSKIQVNDQEDYYLESFLNKGLNFNFFINPIYSIKYLRNIDVGVDLNLALNNIITNNSLSLAFIYNIPLAINLPNWTVNLNLFIGGGYGLRFTKVMEYYPYYDNISSFGDIKSIKFGLDISPKELVDYGIMFFVEGNVLYSNYYNILENNIKKYKQYQSTSVTMGVVYNINYLIK